MARRPGRPVGGRLGGDVRDRFWEALRVGETVTGAARVAGVSQGCGQQWVAKAGGVLPRKPVGSSGSSGKLGFEERSLIESWLRRDHSPAEIARMLGRSRSTISRELARCGGPDRYRALVAEGSAQHRRERPKARKLAVSDRLRAAVVAGLRKRHSPEQIAGRLRRDHRDDPEMWVSHETIYQAIYVHPRGELSRELKQAIRDGKVLRHGREHRRQQGRKPRTGPIRDLVPISERPEVVEGRQVPGHWEGDLIIGAEGKSAIGTAVERASGFTLLLHLDGDHAAPTVAAAISTVMGQLRQELKRSLTWDRGGEMAHHQQVTLTTGIQVYFADPYSPWQRGSNENTNGLLRQYFPKGTDLSVHSPHHLAEVAAELNDRPRKRHHWATPAEVLAQLLSDQERVATTP